MTRPTAVALALSLGACSNLPAIDHAAIDAGTQRIEPRVVRDCRVLQVAGAIATVASIALPGAGLVEVIIDRACDDPAWTARAIAAGEAVAERLRDQH